MNIDRLPKHAVPVMVILTDEPLSELSVACWIYSLLRGFPERNAAGKVLKIALKEIAATEWQKRKASSA